MQATHPLKKGDKAKVFNMTFGGQLIEEGIATIVKPVRGVSGYYAVRFEGDEGTVQRFIQPENKL